MELQAERQLLVEAHGIEGALEMSSIQVSGQGRALPFTGFAALPFLLVGTALTVAGGVMALLRPKHRTARQTP